MACIPFRLGPEVNTQLAPGISGMPFLVIKGLPPGGTFFFFDYTLLSWARRRIIKKIFFFLSFPPKKAYLQLISDWQTYYPC